MYDNEESNKESFEMPREMPREEPREEEPEEDGIVTHYPPEAGHLPAHSPFTYPDPIYGYGYAADDYRPHGVYDN